MSLGRITVDLLARTGQFETDLNRAGKLAERRAKEIDRQFKAAGRAIGLALVAGASAAAVAIKGSIDRMDELSKAAQRAQMPTEDFSRLAYASSLADVAMGDLTKSMGKLSKAQWDASRGLKEQKDAFAELGIDAIDPLTGKLRRTSEVFMDFADAFQRHQGSPEVMALGMQIFGRSFQNLIPLLKDGRQGLKDAADEADRLGYTISTEAGRNAEEFNDNLTRLKTAAMGLANEVADNLLPDLIGLSQGFLTTATEGDKLSRTADELSGFLRGLGIVAHIVSSAFEITGTSMAAFAIQTKSLAQLLSGDVVGSANSVREAYRMMGEEYREAFGMDGAGGPGPVEVKMITGSSGSIDPRALRTPFAPACISLPTDGSTRKRERPDFAKGAADELRQLVELEARARDGFAAMEAQLAGPLAAAFHQYQADQAELNRLADEGVIGSDRLREAQANLAEQYREDVAAIEARKTPAEQMLGDLALEIEVTRAVGLDKEKLIALRYAGADAASAEGRAIAGMIEELAAAREAEALVLDLQGVFADFAAEALMDFGNVGDAFDDMADRMKRIAAQMLADKAVQWLFNMFGNMLGGSASSPSADFAGSFGNNTGWLSDGSYGGAGGGMFGTGGGQVMPMGGGQVSGGGVELNVYGSQGQARTETSTAPDGRRIIDLFLGEAARDVRQGGKLSKAMQQTFGVQRAGVARG